MGTKFKVGDKVMVTDPMYAEDIIYCNKVFTVNNVDDAGDCYVDENDDIWIESELTKVEEKKPMEENYAILLAGVLVRESNLKKELEELKEELRRSDQSNTDLRKHLESEDCKKCKELEVVVDAYKRKVIRLDSEKNMWFREYQDLKETFR